ncbi:ABC transporter permease [Streptomyces orinoci]|uniref:ABC transporter permease n=1 Tax=Streptomyces orinoci TaxID=67339 RepID=A0ABV3K4X4_STRON|nr:ABC transporter permease [Streptomyces orinoci]
MTLTAVPAAATEPSARFRDLLHSEWIKLWSLRSIRWAFLLGGLAIIGINASAAMADYNNWPHYSPAMQADPWMWGLRDSFTNEGGMVLMLVAGSMGAITLVGEYGTGLIRTTFGAVPDRRSVVLAKTAVVTVVFTGFGLAVVIASYLAGNSILAGRHADASLSSPGAVRVLAASVLLSPLAALAGLGLGAIIRHSATTMVTTAFVLLLLPNLFTERRWWSAAVNHAMLYSAWRRLVDSNPQYPAVLHRASVGGSWTVFAVWSLLAVVVAVVLVDRRDV